MPENRQELARLFRLLGHELRAPLNAVSGYLDLIGEKIRRGGSPEDCDYMLERCDARIDELRNFLDALLKTAFAKDAQRPRDLTPVNLVACAFAAVADLDSLAEINAVGIQVHSERNAESPFLADPAELSVIFNNLLTNAIKYNKKPGKVDIFLAREADQATIRVVDTGIGFAPDEIELLFVPFTRIKKAQTRDISGNGLGLTIIQDLVTLYNGDISVTSDEGSGSQFTVKLFQPQGQDI